MVSPASSCRRKVVVVLPGDDRDQPWWSPRPHAHPVACARDPQLAGSAERGVRRGVVGPRFAPLDAGGFHDRDAGLEGAVKLWFTLFGQAFRAISAGTLDAVHHAVFVRRRLRRSGEVDRYWNALTRTARPRTGWVKDKFGVLWKNRAEGARPAISDPRSRQGRRVTRMLKNEEG